MKNTISNIKSRRSSIQIPELEKQYGKPIQEIVRELYIDKNIGICKISKELHLSITQIYKLFKIAGIEPKHDWAPSKEQRNKIAEKIRTRFNTDPTYKQKISESRKKYYKDNPLAKEQAKAKLAELRIQNIDRLKNDDEYRQKQLSGLFNRSHRDYAYKKINKDILYDLYITQKKDMGAIATCLNTTIAIINHAMKYNNIPIRSKTESQKISHARTEVQAKLSERSKRAWQDPLYRKLKTDQAIGEKNSFYGQHHNPITQQKMRENRQKLNESGWKPHNTEKPIREWIKDIDSWAKNMLTNRFFEPNIAEKELLVILSKLNIDIFYNGTGSFLVIDGLVPDYVCFGKKKVIELFGENFHDADRYYSCFGKKMPVRNSESYRRQVFKEHGYDLLVIWVNELKKGDLYILNKVKDFLEI